MGLIGAREVPLANHPSSGFWLVTETDTQIYPKRSLKEYRQGQTGTKHDAEKTEVTLPLTKDRNRDTECTKYVPGNQAKVTQESLRKFKFFLY